MAQLFCLPLLLLVTIPLLVVSVTVVPWPKEGANYSFPYNCGGNWTTRLKCEGGRWIWELKCKAVENYKFKEMFVAWPPNSSVSNNTNSTTMFYQSDNNVIKLMNVTGRIKACLINDTFFLTNESRQNIDKCVKNCQCSNVFNSEKRNQNQNIIIHVQSTDECTVDIQIEQEHYLISCTGRNTTLKFHREPKSWIDALKTCRRGKDSELVHITNSCVWCDVQSLLNNKTNMTVLPEGVWIGLERSIFGCDPTWMWTSGIGVTYAHWNSTKRVDPLNNHCGKVVWVESKNYTWVDENCFKKLPFICTVLT